MTFLFLVAGILYATAQVTVEAKIDSIEMFIGEQAHVQVTVTAGTAQRVVFPVFKSQQMITPGVEVLSASDTRKEELDNNKANYIRTYTVTSFDGNLYYLPPFKVKVDNRQYESKSLALKVLEVEVDTTQTDKFFGPKDVQNNPFAWSDWSLVFWLSVLSLLLASCAIYVYIRLRQGKPIITAIKIIRHIPPHQKAMKAIEQIKADKMVTAENPKEYYTRLTDTLRKYIQERYGFSAMEMTSSEIIERLNAAGDMQALEELRQLFMTADLVKFAKHSTLINENDMNLVNAIDFIDRTKLENAPTEEKVVPQLTQEEQRSVTTRRILTVFISVAAVISILIFAYVAYSAYQLIS